MQIVHEVDTPVFITLMAMNVGDCAIFNDKTRANVSSQVKHYRQKDNNKNFAKKFTVRETPNCVKVWRLE